MSNPRLVWQIEKMGCTIGQLRAEIERLQTQLGLATCWNNTLIKMAGLEGSWVDGGVSVRQVADALRGNQQPASMPNDACRKLDVAYAEVERLRAALQTIARGDDGMDSHTALGMQHIAREALNQQQVWDTKDD